MKSALIHQNSNELNFSMKTGVHNFGTFVLYITNYQPINPMRTKPQWFHLPLRLRRFWHFSIARGTAPPQRQGQGWCSTIRNWQLKPECGAATFLRFDPNEATVTLDQRFANGKPQPASLFLRFTVLRKLLKTRK